MSLRPLDRGAEFVAEWSALEREALEGNAFLSPNFVLPALRWLTPRRTVLALSARLGGRLVGLGVFEPRAASSRVPMLHLRSYGCEHTYLSGLLLSRDCAEAAANAMFVWLRRWRRVWGGVEFSLRPADGPLAEVMAQASAAAGTPWHAYVDFERATVVPAEVNDVAMAAWWSKNQRKKRRRSQRALEATGPVTYVTRWGCRGTDAETERFLELEGMGWKGEGGSALNSAPHREAFFRAMVDGFGATGDNYFSQLRSGDTVVASSMNLVSGDVGFGFKIGWHEDFAEASPGTLHEFEYVGTAAQELERLAFVDATSDADSFVDKIWPHRRQITSGVYASGRASGVAINGLLRARREAKRRWRRRAA